MLFHVGACLLHAYSHLSESGRQTSYLGITTRHSSNNGLYRYRYSVRSNVRKVIPARLLHNNIIAYCYTPLLTYSISASRLVIVFTCRSSETKWLKTFCTIHLFGVRVLGWWASINRTGNCLLFPIDELWQVRYYFIGAIIQHLRIQTRHLSLLFPAGSWVGEPGRLPISV